jgi:hypothetical protein
MAYLIMLLEAHIIQVLIIICKFKKCGFTYMWSSCLAQLREMGRRRSRITLLSWITFPTWAVLKSKISCFIWNRLKKIMTCLLEAHDNMSTDESELQKELSLLQTDSDDEEGDWRKSNISWTDILQNSIWDVHKLKNSDHNTQQNAKCQRWTNVRS